MSSPPSGILYTRVQPTRKEVAECFSREHGPRLRLLRRRLARRVPRLKHLLPAGIWLHPPAGIWLHPPAVKRTAGAAAVKAAAGAAAVNSMAMYGGGVNGGGVKCVEGCVNGCVKGCAKCVNGCVECVNGAGGVEES